MGRLARMVRQFPSSLPTALLCTLIVINVNIAIFFILFLLLCCNRSVNGINKKKNKSQAGCFSY